LINPRTRNFLVVYYSDPFLVSGRADALSGRYINANRDKEEDLVRRTEEIQREDLHILALRT
jgi:hypothetical protein